ncbi:MAG: hypothetical protein KDA96_18730, partial [Planctomycetaceae bacterium]|nr:hypothetical protein [Planctomycetaceae bacterium]
PWERALRSTLLIRVPGVTGGRSTSAIVQTVDLLPTLLDYCQPQEPALLHPADGRSLRTLLETGNDNNPQRAVSFWGNAISIRDDQRRYVLTVNGNADQLKLSREEVFDMTGGDDGPLVQEAIPEAILQQVRELRRR